MTMKAYHARQALQVATLATLNGTATLEQEATLAIYHARQALQVATLNSTATLARVANSYRVVCQGGKAVRQALHLLGTSDGLVPLPPRKMVDRLYRFGVVLVPMT